MNPEIPQTGDAALTIGLALAAGMTAQAAARHLRVPGIVLLLGTGLLLGPDVLGIVQPAGLGDNLQMMVGFAVAVILFEGGLNLSLKRLRRESRSIRQLVTVGALVTAAGGAIAARVFLRWDWTLCILFGTLVIVTGPTVITPLLRRIRLKRSVATVLEAEGVLIDAIGAVVAVVTLEVLVHPYQETSAGAWDLVFRLGFGSLAGLAGGGILALLLRSERILPEGLENVTVLSLVLAFFQVSNFLLPESGIVTVTVAGITVGNVRTRRLGDLKEFKEQLTMLLIGLLFVLLAADVRVEEVRSLGWSGVLTVLALMLVVRPLNVLAGTAGTDLEAREKAFIAWLAPRGIVAAAVSSLFAQELDAAGIPGGSELRALVFLVIAATVLIQGLFGGVVSRLLGVSRPSSQGWVFLGATPVGLTLGEVFRETGQEVVFLDSNPDSCSAAEQAGFRVLFGNALAERLLVRAELDSRAGSIAVTGNEEVNFMFSRRAREEFKVPVAWLALRSTGERVTSAMVEKVGARVLFGKPLDLEGWSSRLKRGGALAEWWLREDGGAEPEAAEAPRDPDRIALRLAVVRGRSVLLHEPGMSLKRGDRLRVLIAADRQDEARAWLTRIGWRAESQS